MSRHGKILARRPTSFRISEYTMAQINQLGEMLQTSNTETIMLALDRMYRSEFPDRKNPLDYVIEVIEDENDYAVDEMARMGDRSN